MKFRVKYYYLATGMEGRADEIDYGVCETHSAQEAIEEVAMREYPVDIMYGPNNSYSTRDFFRNCLSATEAN